MTFDLANPFHVAQVVTNLERAMDEVGSALGLEWHSIQERTLRCRWKGETIEANLRFTYSKGTEPHLELLEGSEGSIWGPDMTGMHHIGVWTDDFLADVARLEAAGFPVETTLVGSDDTPLGFTYQTSPHGVRIELVPVERKPAFDSWFSGGEYR